MQKRCKVVLYLVILAAVPVQTPKIFRWINKSLELSPKAYRSIGRPIWRSNHFDASRRPWTIRDVGRSLPGTDLRGAPPDSQLAHYHIYVCVRVREKRFLAKLVLSLEVLKYCTYSPVYTYIGRPMYVQYVCTSLRRYIRLYCTYIASPYVHRPAGGCTHTTCMYSTNVHNRSLRFYCMYASRVKWSPVAGRLVASWLVATRPRGHRRPAKRET